MRIVLLTAGLAGCLAGVHFFADRFGPPGQVPRNRWLSAAGGVAVAYVFVHLLPEVGEAARTVTETISAPVTLLERHVYLVSLAGLIVFYGLERYASVADEHPTSEDSVAVEPVRFWVHVGSFAGYNVLIGYLLVNRDDPTVLSLSLYAFAMGLHLLVNDYGLRDDYGRAYHEVGRWLLGSAVLVGAVGGYLVDVREAVTALAVAFLAGGVVLNVIKEELPAERESRFWPFALSAGGYAALLIVV